MVNNSATFRDQEMGVHTNTIEVHQKPLYLKGAGQKNLLLYFFLDI